MNFIDYLTLQVTGAPHCCKLEFNLQSNILSDNILNFVPAILFHEWADVGKWGSDEGATGLWEKNNYVIGEKVGMKNVRMVKQAQVVR